MSIETMIAAYVRCALWSTTGAGNDGEDPLDKDHDASDISEKTMAKMRQDCEAFIERNAEDIGSEHERAGRDLWLTRNHHGAGFWDGGWPKDAGKRLTDAAHAMGEVDLYVGDDGVIYAMDCE